MIINCPFCQEEIICLEELEHCSKCTINNLYKFMVFIMNNSIVEMQLVFNEYIITFDYLNKLTTINKYSYINNSFKYLSEFNLNNLLTNNLNNLSLLEAKIQTIVNFS